MIIINAYQWDTDIPVRIPWTRGDVPVLDFMPDTGSGQSVTPELQDGTLTARCPPQLLTGSRPVQIYARLGNTIDRVGMICVKPRPKPPDYIASPEDVRTWEQLAERIARLEENPAGGGIANETDPTVPDWAKQPQKPEYTAGEVGALPDATTTLPNPHPLTLAGAVSATYDGSKPVTVEIPQGGGDGWELVNTIELSEDSNNVIIDQDSNGNSFELSAFMFYIDRVASELQESNSTLYVGNRGNGYFGQMQGQSPTQTRLWMSGEFMTNHMWRSVGGNGASGNFSASISYAGGCPTSAPMIRLYGYYFGAGTKIYLYGVRK